MVEISDIVFRRLLAIYNNKIKSISRKEFCYLLGINEKDFNRYKMVKDILESNSIAIFKQTFYKTQIRIFISIDLKKLEYYIRDTENFKRVETFIQKSNKFYST